jgi:hypothetical protein
MEAPCAKRRLRHAARGLQQNAGLDRGACRRISSRAIGSDAALVLQHGEVLMLAGPTTPHGQGGYSPGRLERPLKISRTQKIPYESCADFATHPPAPCCSEERAPSALSSAIRNAM